FVATKITPLELSSFFTKGGGGPIDLFPSGLGNAPATKFADELDGVCGLILKYANPMITAISTIATAGIANRSDGIANKPDSHSPKFDYDSRRACRSSALMVAAMPFQMAGET